MTDRLRINHVQLAGNPRAAQTLVLAHGFGTNQASWRFVAKALGDDYRLVTFDLVGHGDADGAAFSRVRYGSLHGFADDLTEICDALRLQQPVMVTQSISGMAAVLASNKRPGRFGKLVTIGASPRYLDDASYTGGFDRAAIDGIYQAIRADFVGWLRGLAPVAMRNLDQPMLASEFAQSLATMSPDIALTLMRTILDMDHRRDVAALDVPTLIIQPQRDPFVPPAVGEYLHRTIRGSTLLPIAAEGHFPHMSRPDEVVAAIRGFV